MSLATRTALVAALAILLTGVGTAGLAILIGHASVRSSALAATAAGAEATGRAVTAYLVEARSTIETVGDIAVAADLWPDAGLAGPAEAPGIRAALGKLVEIDDRFEYVALVRPSGEVLLVEPLSRQGDLSRPDMAFFPWFQELRSRGSAISDLHVSTITHRTSVVVAVAAHDDIGEVLGYIVGGLRTEELSSLVGTSSSEFFGYITDSRGLLVAHGRDARLARAQTDFSQVPSVRRALAGSSGVIEGRNQIEGEDRLSGYRSLPAIGWVVVYVVPSEIAYAPAWSMALTIGAVAAIVIGGFGIAALVLTRRVTEPVVRLSLAAARLAAGERGVALPTPGGDEVGQLARDFGRMVEAVDTRETELRTVVDQLRTTNQELEAFTYSASHDLRAPLRTIDGFSRILLEDYADFLDVEGRRLLGKVIDSAHQMATLIDDLLALSRVSGKEPERRSVAMGPIVDGVIAELRTNDPERAVTFNVHDLSDAPADPTLLRQVWTNLLSNAWKFTSRVSEPMIDVWSEPGQTERRYFVRDNGAGFEPEYVGNLFQPFRRLHHANQFEGTGIGLAIVARIVGSHGGRVWAEGLPDQGATFGFSLPAPKEAT